MLFLLLLTATLALDHESVEKALNGQNDRRELFSVCVGNHRRRRNMHCGEDHRRRRCVSCNSNQYEHPKCHDNRKNYDTGGKCNNGWASFKDYNTVNRRTRCRDWVQRSEWVGAKYGKSNPARRRSHTAKWRWKKGSPSDWCEIQITGKWEKMTERATEITVETGSERTTVKGDRSDKTWGDDFTREHSSQVSANVGFEVEGVGGGLESSETITSSRTISTGGSSGIYNEMVDMARDTHVATYITPKAELQTNNGVQLYTRMTQWRWIEKKRYGYINARDGQYWEGTSKYVMGSPPIRYTDWQVKKTYHMHGKVDAAALCIEQAPNCYPASQCRDAACMTCHSAKSQLSSRPYSDKTIRFCDDNQLAALGGYRVHYGVCPANNQRITSEEDCIRAAVTRKIHHDGVVDRCYDGRTNIASAGCFICPRGNKKDLAFVRSGYRAASSSLMFLCKDHVNVEEEVAAKEEEELATLDCIFVLETAEAKQCQSMCAACDLDPSNGSVIVDESDDCPATCVACEKYERCKEVSEQSEESKLTDMLMGLLEDEE